MVSVLTRHGYFSPYRRDSLPDGRSVLRKVVEPHHELITPPGVAVSLSVLEEAEEIGCAGIVVRRVKTGETLWAAVDRWRRGIPISRGYGPQRALKWSELSPVGGDSGQLELFPREGLL